MKNRICCVALVLMLFSCSLVIIKNHENYMNLLEVNEQMTELIDEQRDVYNKSLKQWQNNYEELSIKYGTLLEEKDQLDSRMGEVDIPIYNFTRSEIYLLARCVQAEAGCYKQAWISQQYIAQVILNRLHSSEFPNYLDEVIYQKVSGVPQFSVAYDGALDKVKLEPETLANVYEVVVHGANIPENILYFYSEEVTDNWVNTLDVYDTIQGTVFAYYND